MKPFRKFLFWKALAFARKLCPDCEMIVRVR